MGREGWCLMLRRANGKEEVGGGGEAGGPGTHADHVAVAVRHSGGGEARGAGSHDAMLLHCVTAEEGRSRAQVPSLTKEVLLAWVPVGLPPTMMGSERMSELQGPSLTKEHSCSASRAS